MVALSADSQPSTCKSFTAEISLSKGETMTLVPGRSEIVVHILHTQVCAKLEEVIEVSHVNFASDIEEKVVLRPGQHAVVKFSMKKPLFVRKGMKIILRDRYVRGIGRVASVPSGEN